MFLNISRDDEEDVDYCSLARTLQELTTYIWKLVLDKYSKAKQAQAQNREVSNFTEKKFEEMILMRVGVG